MFTRRSLLGSLLATPLVPRLARAAEPGDRKFVFVFAPGGWDPTRVLAPDGFDVAGVDMDDGAERASAGGIAYVDHPARPAVRRFFDAHHARSCVLNGVMVRSIAHDICTLIAMTGTSDGTAADWPAILADTDRARYTLPHLVLDGPSFPGDRGVAVARTGYDGQLASLLSGRIESDVEVTPLSRPSEAQIDRYLARRLAARREGASSALDRRLAADLHDSHAKATALKDLQYGIDLSTGGDFGGQIGVAVDALALGLSRCVTLAHPGSAQGWDTHTNNDPDQSFAWESLFQGLVELVALLERTPGPAGSVLADETTLVVLSEMGRTPALNGFGGKDHWPYTSALLWGDGVAGDRVIGGFDAQWFGDLVDGQIVSAEAVGATLLALADVDPAEHVSGVSPLTDVIA